MRHFGKLIENKDSQTSIKMKSVDSQKEFGNPFDKENETLRPYLKKQSYKNVEDYVHTLKAKGIPHQLVEEV